MILMIREADIFSAHFMLCLYSFVPYSVVNKTSEHFDNITNQAVACNPMQFGDGRSDGAVGQPNGDNRMKSERTSKQLDMFQSQDGKNVWRSQ